MQPTLTSHFLPRPRWPIASVPLLWCAALAACGETETGVMRPVADARTELAALDAVPDPTDAGAASPDALPTDPDTEASPPDAAASPPDAAASPPDAAASPPDAAAPSPDAAAPPTDAAVSPPDAAPPCGPGVPYLPLDIARAAGGGPEPGFLAVVDLVFPDAPGVLDSPGCGPGTRGEVVVGLELDAPARVVGRLESPGGGVQLSLRSACGDPATELTCGAPEFGAATAAATTDAPASLFFVAEGGAYEPARQARLTVTIDPPSPPPTPSAECPAADSAVATPLAGGLLPIDTTGRADVFPTCLELSRLAAPEQIVVLTLEVPSAVRVETRSADADPVLGLWGACEPAAAPLRCDDDSGPGNEARLDLPRLEAGTYFVSVEGRGVGDDPGLRCDLDIAITPLPTPACDDGADNDADGLTDLADTGCLSALDADEGEPVFPTDCADGVDNDQDGLTDHPADPDCAAAGQNAESGACGPGVPYFVLPQGTGEWPIDPGPGVDLFRPWCADRAGPGYLFELPLETRARVEVNVTDARGQVPVVLATYGVCYFEAAAEACRPALSASPLVVPDHPAGRLYLRVQVGPDEASGPLTLRTRVDSLIRACNNGEDDDGDGITDVFDPGCDREMDDDETDSATPPACADGADNDHDGAVDYPADAECRAAGGLSEEPTCALDVPLTRMGSGGGRVTLTTEGHDRYQASCGNAQGPEQVLVLSLARAADVRVTVENNTYDTVLFLRAACDEPGTELACNDDTHELASELVLPALPAGRYFIFLDGYGGQAGTAEVVVAVTPVEDAPFEPQP